MKNKKEKHVMTRYIVKQTEEFAEWLHEQQDFRLRSAVLRRLDQISEGNFGNHKSVKGGVSELKINQGPGYRIYYTIRDRTIVFLLCAGDKSTQNKDIKKAQEMAKEV